MTHLLSKSASRTCCEEVPYADDTKHTADPARDRHLPTCVLGASEARESRSSERYGLGGGSSLTQFRRSVSFFGSVRRISPTAPTSPSRMIPVHVDLHMQSQRSSEIVLPTIQKLLPATSALSTYMCIYTNSYAIPEIVQAAHFRVHAYQIVSLPAPRPEWSSHFSAEQPPAHPRPTLPLRLR